MALQLLTKYAYVTLASALTNMRLTFLMATITVKLVHHVCLVRSLKNAHTIRNEGSHFHSVIPECKPGIHTCYLLKAIQIYCLRAEFSSGK